MNYVKNRLPRVCAIFALGLLCTLCGPENAEGRLHWPAAKKVSLRVRLIALAWNHPHSSFFASQEVFIAEKALSGDETQLVKLVYGFLPYQPRLSETGFDYSTVHELRAVRDKSCDEPLSQLTSGETGDWRQTNPGLTYSADAPVLNPQRRRAAVPCYVTSADDYDKKVHKPAAP